MTFKEIRVVADQRIKSLADQIPTLALLNAPPLSHSPTELEKFGITDDLREFVQGLTSSTFHFTSQITPTLAT